MTRRVLGHVCIKDEADRYLPAVLAWQKRFLDDIHVYDDLSTDEGPALAHDMGLEVECKPAFTPGFLTDEREFRQAAWRSMERLLAPKDGDWIFCFDADEVFVSPDGAERRALERLTDEAALRRRNSVRFRVDEIFEVVAGRPHRRVDGYWGSISAVRLARYVPGGIFPSKRMGCGSVPSYAVSAHDARGSECSILHFGYARQEDRTKKYERYSSIADNGHAGDHIESILATPRLEALDRVSPL
jgi:hypothetical protein